MNAQCKNNYKNRLIRHIEENLPFALDAGLLSRAVAVSHAQLYRDFYNMTGHSVKEYIRKRRLSNALALVKASDFSLADIACQCGYSSQQALSRAVKQTLGMTLLEYKGCGLYYFFPPYEGEPVQAVTLTSETFPQALCLRFYHSSLKDIENKAVTTFLELNPDYKGRIFGRDGKQRGSRFCYEIYLSDANINVPVLEEYGYVRSKTAASFSGTFASSCVKNREELINAAWNYLYHIWLQNSMFESAKEPYFEEYLLRSGKPAKLKLYLPIQKRGDETKITLVSDPQLCFVVAGAKGGSAEKLASERVIAYLLEHAPQAIRSSREFYLQREGVSCCCGVRVDDGLQLQEGAPVERIATGKGRYLMLSSSVMGDYDRYAGLLLSFATDNGMTVDQKGIFAVYDAKESFDNPKIRMYCPIQKNLILRQTDNTGSKNPVMMDS